MKYNNFYSWLGKQRYRPDEVGDLAKLALRDSSWPIKRRTFAGLKNYLNEHYYFEEAFQGLEKAWKEWERHKGCAD